MAVPTKIVWRFGGGGGGCGCCFVSMGILKSALRIRISAVSMPRTVCQNKWLRNARIYRQAFLLYTSLIFNLLYPSVTLHAAPGCNCKSSDFFAR